MSSPEWIAWCKTLGMNDEAVDFFRDQVGIPGPTELRTQVALSEFPTFLKTVSKQILSVTPPANTPKPIFPWPAQRTFHALRMYLDYRVAASLSMEEAQVLKRFQSGNTTALWLEHLSKVRQMEQETAEEDPISVPKLRSFTRWVPFKEMMQTKLLHQRNPVLGHRLTYLLRDYGVATTEMHSVSYPSLEEKIEATVTHKGPN